MVLPTRGAQGEKGRDPPPQPKLHHELVRFVWPNPFSPSSMLGPEKEVAALWMVRCRTCELDAKALLLVVLPADMLTRRLAPQAKKIGTLRRLLGAKVSPDDEAVQVTYNDDGFVDVTMSRPDMHNAFSDRVIKRFSNVFIELRARSGAWMRLAGEAVPLPLCAPVRRTGR